jgi:hypothetical protein
MLTPSVLIPTDADYQRVLGNLPQATLIEKKTVRQAGACACAACVSVCAVCRADLIERKTTREAGACACAACRANLIES